MKLITIQQSKDLITRVLEKVRVKYATKNEIEEAVELKGPDGKTYRLAIDDDYRLKAVEYLNNQSVNYLISGTDYYYIEEDEPGIASIVKTTTMEENTTSGYIRTIDLGTCIKYQISIENGGIVFNECTEETSDTEAKYLVCRNNPNKLYSFKIYEGIVYLEAVTSEISSINIR